MFQLLRIRRTMRDASRSGGVVGSHDGCGALYRAVHRWGATMVEFHEIEGQGPEFDTGRCWLPGQRKPVIAALRKALRTEGDAVGEPSRSELEENDWRADSPDGLRSTAANRVPLAQGTSR